jgi:ComF family protein
VPLEAHNNIFNRLAVSENPKVSVISWQHKARQLAGTFFDFIFPPTCAICRKEGYLFCDDCRLDIQWIKEPICEKCGRLQKRPIPQCSACMQHPPPLQQIRAAVMFAPPIQPLIHKLKYENMFGLAPVLAQLMVQAWSLWQTEVDLVVPIPLHPKRRQKRGYNQSEKLAQYFCFSLGFRQAAKGLQRIRDTQPQVGLNATDRLQNVQAAFEALQEIVEGKTVLLIDDVCTTGATLSAASESLMKAGAKSVSAYCLARAM